MNMKLTQERLKQILHYDPQSGDWTRLVTRNNNAKMGVVAGSKKPTGYILIGVDGTIYRAHRLAWLYMTGRWPRNQIDHKDGNPSNNCWLNLREATNGQNKANSLKNSNNTSGLKGVSWNKFHKKWYAYIGLNGRKESLGYYQTKEEAHSAYLAAAKANFGEFARAS